MNDDEVLTMKAKQYANLAEMKKNIEGRMDELRKDLSKLTPGKYQFDNIELEVQLRNRTTLIDREELHYYMETRGIDPHEYSYLVPDPASIEVLYLDGTLDDNDLRAIRKPQYTTALVPRRLDVQGND